MDEINTEVQDKALEETLVRAGSMELLVNSQPWVYIKSYIENMIQSFANRAIKEGFKSLEEFNIERGKVLALTNLIGEIDNDLRILRTERAKPKESTKK